MSEKWYEQTDEEIRVIISLLIKAIMSAGGKHRCMYPSAMKRASRVLDLRWVPPGHWIMDKDWRGRLRLAGIDENGEVTDEYRWGLCWEQLRETGTFRDDVQRKWIALGRESQPVEPVVVATVRTPKKEKKEDEFGFNEYLRSEIIKKTRKKR